MLCACTEMFIIMATSLIALSTDLPRVVVVGGTHGNEYTGVYVLEQAGALSTQPYTSGL